MRPASNASFDVLVHGATGFTGRRAAARLVARRPRGLRIALAGRSEAKLGALSSLLGGLPWFVAEAADPASVERAVREARVVVNCAGPFSLYGDPVVDACVEHGVHYVDITGETSWARRLIDRHDARAAESGTRIVPFCGFDSVPADLGVLALAAEAARRGEQLRDVLGVYRIRGGLNGGTWATAMHLSGSEDSELLGDPYLMVPGVDVALGERARQADPRQPVREPATGKWCPPFFMGSINRRVVQRSALLHAERGRGSAAYGPSFRYTEHQSTGGGSRTRATLSTAASRAAARLLTLRAARALARPLGPKPGEGPSERVIETGYSRLDLYAELTGGTSLHRRIEIDGDPGNRATVLSLTEAALALIEQGPELRLDTPGTGGVLTPALALGECLEQRLAKTGEWRAAWQG